ncbi:MAG TPA: ATP-grasp domain-containing protein, partial [Aggregatilineales bacterium]|nr:ATP-grasp domain-containing protein [Aggregatilineales bacterium]
FLAENATFAQAVADAGLIFIGPTPSAIEAMGKKRESKLMLKNVPMVAGYNDTDQADSTLISAAEKIGYPIMVKASAGGGGKGMRRVNSPDELPEALATARREAKQAFGDDTLILEHYVTNPRHIEIQIFGDTHGNVIAFGERECSIQRRHQKVVEETPSTALDDELRAKICATAVSIGQQLGYVSAGTIEFLLDDKKNYYFMEMNTRLQVEH